MRIPSRRLSLISVIFLAAWAAVTPNSCAGDSADVSVPATVSFVVLDLDEQTTGSPDPTTISFSNASLMPGGYVTFAIKADAADFTRPIEEGNTIPASAVSWTVGGASNGTGSPGTLSESAYTLVFQSNADATSGSADITWTLAAVGSGVHAGDHTLSATWKIESFFPGGPPSPWQ